MIRLGSDQRDKYTKQYKRDRNITDSPNLVDVGHKELAAGRAELTRPNRELKEENLIFLHICATFFYSPV